MTPSKLGWIYMIGWRPKRKKTKIIKIIDPLTNLIKEKNEGPISWLAIAMRANNEFAAKADIVRMTIKKSFPILKFFFLMTFLLKYLFYLKN